MRPARSLRSAAVAAGACLLLAACGGGDGDDGATPGRGESTSVEAPGPEEPTSSDDRPTQAPTTRPTTEPSPSERPPQERPTTEPERPPSPGDEPAPADPPADDPDGDDREGDPGGGGRPTTDPEDGGEPTTPTTPEPVHGPTSPVRFGETYRWDNGLAVTVEAPHPLDEATSSGGEDESDEATPEARRTEPPDDASHEETPTATPDEGGAAGTAPAGDVLVFDVTVVNGTPEDVGALYIAPKIGGSACRCTEHFDPGAGLTGTPNGTLPPGEEISFSVAFSTSSQEDLGLQVWPEYRYTPALFVDDAGSA